MTIDEVALRRAARLSTRDIVLSLIEIGVFAASIGVCAWALWAGGVFGLAGGAAGAVMGSFRPRSAALQRRLRAAFDGAFAGLWAGIMLGGMSGGALVQAATR